jgi:hypothetical protein
MCCRGVRWRCRVINGVTAIPWGEVKLIPGVNVERTPTLNEAGVSQSQLIRYRDGLVQKLGGWLGFGFTVTGLPRDLHAWSDLSGINYLAIGTTNQISIIKSTGPVHQSDVTPYFSFSTALAANGVISQTNASSSVVDLPLGGTEAAGDNFSTGDLWEFFGPATVGNAGVNGWYPITVSISGSYPNQVYTATIDLGTVVGTTATNPTLNFPVFTTQAGLRAVNVNLSNHGLSTGQVVDFQLTTTVGGTQIVGALEVLSPIDANNFTVAGTVAATSSASATLNGGLGAVIFYTTAASYSTVVSPSNVKLTATDWTLSNWGQDLIACPRNGPIFFYSPTSGNAICSVIGTAPPLNAGCFVSTAQQVIMAWGSTQNDNSGEHQDAMLVKYSDVGDFTVWNDLPTNLAGQFRIPKGSTIVGGTAAPNQNLFWTNIGLWSAVFVGFPLAWSFNELASGCGLISAHAMQQLGGSVYWMSQNNFFVYDGGGVRPLTCPVWDFVFQNLSTMTLGNGLPATSNIRAMPNSAFNEVGWLFPSSSSVDGECDSYVKFNTAEPGQPWDYGMLNRSTWIDQSVWGPPLATDSSGVIYQHEVSNDTNPSSFTTGYFYIGEGEDVFIVDQIIPDMKWKEFSGGASANVNITVNVVDEPNDQVRSYGPYTFNSSMPLLEDVRIRGRQGSFTIGSTELGTFWRLGKIRYRYAPDGRR